jgi:hypothetical protein
LLEEAGDALAACFDQMEGDAHGLSLRSGAVAGSRKFRREGWKGGGWGGAPVWA